MDCTVVFLHNEDSIKQAIVYWESKGFFLDLTHTKQMQYFSNGYRYMGVLNNDFDMYKPEDVNLYRPRVICLPTNEKRKELVDINFDKIKNTKF